MENLIKKHAKSFYWASFFLSRPVFDKCSSLYNFCRTLDDIVDDDKNLEIKKENIFIKKLKKKINSPEISAYFVHSYNFETKNSDYKIMSTHYGQEITAMVTKNNIIGVQFHPEKSHKFGIKFLEAFLENEEF